MRWSLPACSISVISVGEDVAFTPREFEFVFHADDSDERYPEFRNLLNRLTHLGFGCGAIPVSGICAFQAKRLVGTGRITSDVMIEFSGGGAQWLRNLVATLEAVAALNESRHVRTQFYDPCSI